MKGVDKIRNNLQDFFVTKEEKVDFHIKYWVSLELIQQN